MLLPQNQQGGYSSRTKQIERQRQMAEALRKQALVAPQGTVTPHIQGSAEFGPLPQIYTAPSWTEHLARGLQQVGAAREEDLASKAEAENEAQMRKEFEDWVSGMPGATAPVPPPAAAPAPTPTPFVENTPEAFTTPYVDNSAPPQALPSAVAGLSGAAIPTPGSPPEIAPTPLGTVPVSDPLAENRAKMQWAARGMDNPLAQALATEAWKKGIEFPEKMAEQQRAQEAKKELELQRAENQLNYLRTQLASVDKNSEAGRELKRQIAQMENNLGYYKAENKPAKLVQVRTIDAQGNPVTKFVDASQIEAGQEFAAAPDAMTMRGRQENLAQQGKVKGALDLVAENPEAFGFRTFLPSFILDRIDPEGTNARVAVAAITNAQIKDMSGAAVSAHEQFRLNKMLPAPGDDPVVVVKKLMAYQKELDDKGYTLNPRSAEAAPAAAPAQALPKSNPKPSKTIKWDEL